MPMKIDPRDRKLLLGALAVFVVLIIGTALLGGEGGQNIDLPSTYSTNSGGAKAAYLLLQGAGYKLQRWERPLDQLPHGSGQIVILAQPNEAPTAADRKRLQAFLREGGRIIATGMFAGTYLPENRSVPDLVRGGVWTTASAVSPSPITRAAPEITIAPEAEWPAESEAYPLYAHGSHNLVVKYPYGRGEILWWASATPLTNAGLRENGNLEFLFACLGDSSHEILWDEYIHGYRETLGASVAHSPVKWIVLQLALLGLAVVITFSRRSGPTLSPVTEVRLSPIEFVQTLGGLYERSSTPSIAVDICYQRFRYWLTRRLGLGSNVSPNDLEVSVRERWHDSNERFGAILRRCESAKNDPYLQGNEALHLVQELDEYAARFRLFESARKEKVR